MICPLFFAQAGWWFNSCFHAILTTGATTIATYYYTTTYTYTTGYHTDPRIMWDENALNTKYSLDTTKYYNNWLKFSAGKFTLKLK